MTTETLNRDQIQIWNILSRIQDALINKDAAALDELHTADFIGAIPTGNSFAKEEYVKHHCNPHFGIVSLTNEDISKASIRFYNNTAVVNRRVHSQFKLPTGNIIDYDVQRIEVFIKTSGEWKLVSGHGTQVKPLGQPQSNN